MMHAATLPLYRNGPGAKRLDMLLPLSPPSYIYLINHGEHEAQHVVAVRLTAFEISKC